MDELRGQFYEVAKSVDRWLYRGGEDAVMNAFLAAARSYGDQCRRAGAEAAQEAAAKVLENGSFLHDKSPSAIWAKQVAALIRSLPLPSVAEAASPAAGWQLAPIEPSEAALKAAREAYVAEMETRPVPEAFQPHNVLLAFRAAYRAVIEASPAPSEEARAG